jgi:DNA-binding GntR family transcriptional regulator
MMEELRAACSAHDFATMAELDIAFHRSILDRAGDPALVSIWSSIAVQVADYFRRWHKRYADPMDHYYEHANIVATFRAGNKEEAIRLHSEMIGAHHLIRLPVMNGI